MAATALLAALAEHLAAQHDLAPPAWTELRVLRQPWFPAETQVQRADALARAPAAFRKHGVYLSATDLEAAWLSPATSFSTGRNSNGRSQLWVSPRPAWLVADVFVVGGAAMALAYDAARVTRDVDSLFVPHGIVLEEARNVAKDLGMPPWWLNEQASVYISGKDDPGKRRVFDHPCLRVTAASSRHIFAMKAFAARTRDIDDLRLLAYIIGIDSSATALQICAEFFPDEDVPPRSIAILQELFG